MTSWTAHLKPGRAPVLVREGWSWGAAAFGPLWLVSQRAWIPAVLHLSACAVLLGLTPGGLRWVMVLALAVLTGLLGRDMLRWSLARRGYVLAHVLVARDEEGALGRLLTARTDVAAMFAQHLA